MRVTLENFKERSSKTHNNKYEYSKITSIARATDYVDIVCPIHGVFTQQVKKHLKGNGCRECGLNSFHRRKVKDTDTFKEVATKLHGDLYDYSKVDYQRARSPVTITCTKCDNTFEILPKKHLAGIGCNICNKGVAYDTETFIRLSKKRYPDKLEYHNTEYVNSFIPVNVTCKIHGDIQVTPANHLTCNSHHCNHCANFSKPTVEFFIDESNRVHDSKYDYSLVTTLHTEDFKVPIICKEHGMFEQYHVSHMQGKGCRKCNCGGFYTDRIGRLYILGCSDYIKIGITNRDVSDRLYEVQRKSPYDWDILHVFESNGQEIADFERVILRSFDFGISKDVIHTGYTEAISSEKYLEVLSLFNSLITKKEN